MKRIVTMTLILFVVAISTAWAQQRQAFPPNMGKLGHHRPFNALSRSSATPAQNAKVWDLGAQKGTIITFDAPGAAAGTYGWFINDRGVILGWYHLDVNIVHHSYLRARNGTITTIDDPVAATDPCQGTNAWAINQEGAVTGNYEDASDVFHGFLRAPDGRFTTFDAPGAGSTGGYCGGQGTVAVGINPEGTIAGWYIDGNDVNHGYVRARDGTITEFDAPGAGADPGQGTLMNQWNGVTHPINPAGAITGWYIDGNNVNHGFLRAPDGTITEFDAPGAGTNAYQGTMVGGINPAGAIVGQYGDANDAWHSYLRAPDGSFTTFDVPGAGIEYTTAYDINPGGEITGFYYDANADRISGFLRAPDGRFTTFDVPGAVDTIPASINSAGAITGFWVDADGAVHGFLRPAMPRDRSLP